MVMMRKMNKNLKGKNPLNKSTPLSNSPFIGDKRGDERILSIYLFIIYIIVSIGVVSGVLLFHGAGLDIRIVEAGVLSDKIINCLVEEGELKDEILEEDFDLTSFCKINLKDNSASYDGEVQLGVGVELFDFNSCVKEEIEGETEISCTNNLRNKIEVGRNDYFGFCELEGDKIPKCSEKYIYVLNNGDEIMLKVLSAIRKVEKNA